MNSHPELVEGLGLNVVSPFDKLRVRCLIE